MLIYSNIRITINNVNVILISMLIITELTRLPTPRQNLPSHLHILSHQLGLTQEVDVGQELHVPLPLQDYRDLGCGEVTVAGANTGNLGNI